MIKRVLVYTYGAQPHDNMMEVAATFAAKNKAQIIGLFVKPDYVNYANVYGQFPLNMTTTFYQHQDEFAQKAQERFEEICQQTDCDSEWHTVDQYEPTPKPSLYTDCIFVSQPQPIVDTVFEPSAFIDALIVSSSAPVFVIPENWKSEVFARKPVLGWKECKEAANAVRNGLDIMQTAKSVDVVTVNSKRRKSKPGEENELISGIQINEYLSLHGIECTFFAETMSNEDKREADALIRHINEHKRDLLILGAYSHSRFRESILGGMTKHMIRKCPIPAMYVN